MVFQASSDHYSTHIRYAVVLDEDTSRQLIIDAFKKRHCYATNDNIVLIVSSGDHLMDDEFGINVQPRVQIHVDAAREISRLHLIRNSRYVYTTQSNKSRFDLSYTDATIVSGKTNYYYVRVEQADGSLAWVSPMWITYQP